MLDVQTLITTIVSVVTIVGAIVGAYTFLYKRFLKKLEERSFNDWCVIGELYRFQKKWESSKYAFEHAKRLKKDAPTPYAGLSRVYRDESKQVTSTKKGFLLRLARLNCEKAIEVSPDFAPAYIDLATIKCAQSGTFTEEVKAALERAIGLDASLKRYILEEEEFTAYRNMEWFRPFIE